MEFIKEVNERRSKSRFNMQRDVRYKVTGDGVPQTAGSGKTINMSSEGVAFEADHVISPGGFVELSISWPVLLGDTCPMRLIVFGRVLRTSGNTAIASIHKYEFRTAPRSFRPVTAVRSDDMLQ